MQTERMQKTMPFPGTDLATPEYSVTVLAGFVRQWRGTCSATAEENITPGQYRQRNSPTKSQKRPSQMQTSSLNNLFCATQIGLKVNGMGLKDSLFVFSLTVCFSFQQQPMKNPSGTEKERIVLNIIIPFVLIIMTICHENKTMHTSLLPLCSPNVKHTGATDVQVLAIKDFFPDTFFFFY